MFSPTLLVDERLPKPFNQNNEVMFSLIEQEI